jgi:serine/threonine-protein kinase
MHPERWREVSRIYGAVLTRPESDRPAVLAELCANDAELRREVESLLASGTGAALLERAAVERPSVMAMTNGVTIGSRIGVFDIQSLLGVGGMGEVYRARDTKLNREVAIKILPAAFASDPDRLARFKREAQVLAALNHPNIAGIHGFEDSGATHALVMELVEGPTLAEMLEPPSPRGPSPDRARLPQGLPVEQALRIARQVAEALETAHEQGIIHRDLKPANIKVREDGTVKVLDFGLAKFAEASSPRAVDARAASLSQSPTITTPAMTAAGMILGTAAYMSPEQAKGRIADRRSDVWSFGCVLFEMLTAKRAFEAEDVSETLAAVLRAEPSWETLPRDLDPRIAVVIRRCLQKDARKRWQAIGDLRYELEQIATQPLPAAHPEPAVARGTSVPALPVALGVTLLVAVAIALTRWLSVLPPPPKLVTRLSIPLPLATRFPTSAVLNSAAGRWVAVAPDGRAIAFLADDKLYLRKLSEPEPVLLRALDGGTGNPVFSPDGQSLALSSGSGGGRTLIRQSLSGGALISIGTLGGQSSFSWSGDRILFYEFARGIQSMPATGSGSPALLVGLDPSVQAHMPQLLPDRETVLFSLVRAGEVLRWDRAQVVVESSRTHQRKVLISDGADAQYVPTGHIVYASGGTLMAVPFDPRRLELSGPAVPIVQGIRRGTASGLAQYSFSNEGTLAYVPGPESPGGLTLNTLDRNGTVDPLRQRRDLYESPRVSPDGTRLAYDTDDGRVANVYVYEISGTVEPRLLTTGGGRNRFPVWSSDGKYVAFQSDREGDAAIWRQRADGTGAAERLTRPQSGVAHVPETWFPKQDRFTFSETSSSAASLWTFDLASRMAERFGTVTSTNAFQSAISPDGRWIAYGIRRAAGRATVNVEPFPSTGTFYEVQVPGAHHPMWSADGAELLFFPAGGQLTSVKVRTAPTFEFETPTVVAGAFVANTTPTSARNHDMTPDGKRIVYVGTAEMDVGAGAPVINVVLNWFEELKALAPPKSP